MRQRLPRPGEVWLTRNADEEPVFVTHADKERVVYERMTQWEEDWKWNAAETWAMDTHGFLYVCRPLSVKDWKK